MSILEWSLRRLAKIGDCDGALCLFGDLLRDSKAWTALASDEAKHEGPATADFSAEGCSGDLFAFDVRG